MDLEKLCSVTIMDGYHLKRCRRLAVIDGMCKLHAASKARSEARSEEYKRQRKADDLLRKEAEKLGKILGIEVSCDWGRKGKFVVLGDWLREAVKKHLLEGRVKEKTPQETKHGTGHGNQREGVAWTYRN